MENVNGAKTKAKNTARKAYLLGFGAFAATFYEAVFRLPKVEQIFSEMLNGERLPMIISSAIYLSRVIQNYWWLILFVLLIAFVIALLRKGKFMTSIWIGIGIICSIAYVWLFIGRIVGSLVLANIAKSLQGL